MGGGAHKLIPIIGPSHALHAINFTAFHCKSFAQLNCVHFNAYGVLLAIYLYLCLYLLLAQLPLLLLLPFLPLLLLLQFCASFHEKSFCKSNREMEMQRSVSHGCKISHQPPRPIEVRITYTYTHTHTCMHIHFLPGRTDLVFGLGNIIYAGGMINNNGVH